VDEVVADQPVGDRLDRDRDPAVGAGAVGQGVGTPLADAVDVDADPDVLPRDVPRPVGAGPDHERGGVAGLGTDLLDPAAQVGAGAEGSEEVQAGTSGVVAASASRRTRDRRGDSMASILSER
jgi:hypothetical protein